jgi:hypothetical protein
MERELWNQLYSVVVRLDNMWTNGFYRAREIVVVFLWAVIHDRPICWACDRRNWQGLTPVCLPSQSTMSRRLRSRDVLLLLANVESELKGDVRRWWVQQIDSKPLPVGCYSKDSDAKLGRAGKRFSLGYKLHTVWGCGVLPSTWRIEPMNSGDATVARKLLADLPGEGYVVGDKQYDSNPLHEVASPHHQIVARQQRPGKGIGHCRHQASRLHAIEMVQRPFGEALLQIRQQIERQFGNLTSFAAGLGPLPSWVRRPHRVRLWVQAKLLINAIRQINNLSKR